ncbi:MAG: 5-oxoprolinase subunit PxpB [Pseudomonadota bacterium]
MDQTPPYEGAPDASLSQEPVYLPCGDAAVTVQFASWRDPAANVAVTALDDALAWDPVPGFLEAAPSFRSLLVRYDPLETDAATVVEALEDLRLGALETALAPTPPRLWRLPVAYGGAEGADLPEVAAETGLTEREVVARHRGAPHRVAMLGFLPGAPYLEGLDAALDLPRRATPRQATPAGSVAIAAGLTVIYPVESPGGWRLLGRTPARLFEVDAAPPALLAPGDLVRFEPASADEVASLVERAARGEWRPPLETALEASRQ